MQIPRPKMGLPLRITLGTVAFLLLGWITVVLSLQLALLDISDDSGPHGASPDLTPREEQAIALSYVHYALDDLEETIEDYSLDENVRTVMIESLLLEAHQAVDDALSEISLITGGLQAEASESPSLLETSALTIGIIVAAVGALSGLITAATGCLHAIAAWRKPAASASPTSA